MHTEEAANTMVNYYTSVTPVLRGQPIYIQFSNHKELKTDSSPNQAVRHPQVWVGGGRVGQVGWGWGTHGTVPTAGPGGPAGCELSPVRKPGPGSLGRGSGCGHGHGRPEPSA